MSARAIASVVIVGSGIVAWSAAAAIRRQLPAIRVVVLSVPVPADAFADRLGCTLPSIGDFHRDIGLAEADTVIRIGSGFRLGTRFEGWSGEGSHFIHSYGDYGRPLGASAFHHHWLRAQGSGRATPFDEYSAGGVMASAGRFLPPDKGSVSRIANYTYGLHIDPPRYRDMMHAFAMHLGAEEHGGAMAEVRIREDGFVDAIVLTDGSELRADLFVDTSGPQAMVRGTVDQDREDWTEYFVADRIAFADLPAPYEPFTMDHAKAFAHGWAWEAASVTRKSGGVIFSSAHLDDARADEIRSGSESIALHPGRLTNPWVRNCVAIGDAAVAIEPLEWTNLHLAHSAIDRLVAMMPDTDCNPVELWDYNRQVNAEADRIRDFVLLHYAVASRPDDPFWQDASSRPLPASLDHTLSQWRERGRLPFYEEETFSRDSWVAVLIGQGVVPRRLDPLLGSVPAKESERMMHQLRAAIRSSVAQAPSYSHYLRSLAFQESR
jgi:tryptophan halogenase